MVFCYGNMAYCIKIDVDIDQVMWCTALAFDSHCCVWYWHPIIQVHGSPSCLLPLQGLLEQCLPFYHQCYLSGATHTGSLHKWGHTVYIQPKLNFCASVGKLVDIQVSAKVCLSETTEDLLLLATAKSEKRKA